MRQPLVRPALASSTIPTTLEEAGIAASGGISSAHIDRHPPRGPSWYLQGEALATHGATLERLRGVRIGSPCREGLDAAGREWPWPPTPLGPFSWNWVDGSSVP